MFASLLLIAALGAVPPAGKLSAPEVTVEFTERSARAAPGALEMVQREQQVVKAQLQRVLGQRWPRPITVRLGADRDEFEALAEPYGKPSENEVALAYPQLDTMLLNARQLTTPQGPTTVRHELYHLALGQMGSFPHWFHEGFAEFLSGDALDMAYYAAMYRGVQTGRIYTFEDLSRRWPRRGAEMVQAYAQSVSFASFLAGRHGPAAFDELFAHVRAGDDFEKAFAKAFHASIGSEEADWRKTLEWRYGTIPVATLISLLWSFTAALCVLAFFRRRAQKEENLRRMDEEAALEALLRVAAEPSPEPPEGDRPPPPAVLH